VTLNSVITTDMHYICSSEASCFCCTKNGKCAYDSYHVTSQSIQNCDGSGLMKLKSTAHQIQHSSTTRCLSSTSGWWSAIYWVNAASGSDDGADQEMLMLRDMTLPVLLLCAASTIGRNSNSEPNASRGWHHWNTEQHAHLPLCLFCSVQRL